VTALDCSAVLRQSKLARHSRTMLALAISVASSGGCAWWATKQEAPDFPRSATGLLLILAAVLVYAVATVVCGWRWHVILCHAHIEHRLAHIEHRLEDAVTRSWFNVGGGTAVGVLVMVRFVVFVPVTIVGLILVMTRYGGLKVLLRRERQAEERGEAALLPADREAIRVPVES
jgi:hypothetical protein